MCTSVGLSVRSRVPVGSRGLRSRYLFVYTVRGQLDGQYHAQGTHSLRAKTNLDFYVHQREQELQFRSATKGPSEVHILIDCRCDPPSCGRPYTPIRLSLEDTSTHLKSANDARESPFEKFAKQMVPPLSMPPPDRRPLGSTHST